MPESTPAPAPQRTLRRRLAVAAGTLALLVAAAWLAVPPLVRTQLESRLTTALGRATTVEAVAFNPFGLQLTIRKLAIADRTGPVPLLAIDEVVADLSTASVWHRAPVLDTLKLVRPRLALARDRDGRYNIQDLIDDALASPPAPPRLSLNNIEIDDGAIAFDDGVTGRKHLLAGLDIGIPFLSTLPYEVDVRVTPRVHGVLNGSRFALTGTTTPFAEHRETALDVDVDALPLPAYVPYLPRTPRIDLAAGALTTRLKVVFVDGKPGTRRLELRGEARVDGLVLKRRDGSKLAGAERIAVTLDRIDLLGRYARVAAVDVDAPTLDINRLADGALEWTRAFGDPAAAAIAPVPKAATTSPASPAPAAVPAAPTAWQVAIAKLAVRRGAIALADETSGFRSALADVALDAANLSTRPGEKAHVKVAFVSADRIASFSGEADVEPTVPAATGRFAFAKFSLGLLFPYYKDALAVDVQKGSLDYATAFALDAAGNLRLTEGEATIADLRLAVPGSRDPLWRMPRVAAAGIDVDVAARRVSLADASISDAALRLVRESAGTLEIARFVRTTPRTGTTADESTWTLLAKKTVLDRVAIDFEDRVPETPVRLTVRELAATVTDFTNARGGRTGVSLRGRVGERGRVAFTGGVVTNPLALDGDVDASALALVALRPYIESHINVVLTGGALAAKGRLAIEVPADAAARMSWKGDLAVTDFAALDKPTASDLARWKSLVLEAADFAIEPFRASVSRIAVSDFTTRVIVYADGSLNAVRLMTPGAAPEPAPDAKPSPAGAAPERAALPVTIGRIELARGNVAFTDLFVRPNYSVDLTDVAGTVTTMSAEQAGDVDLTARLDHVAPVDLRGHIHPFAKALALDLVGRARDVDLPPLTPYSGKYAGYGIEKGKLAFDVHYVIENRRLSAENHLVLDQLTFGARIESPDATKLPVHLAVALLKDSRGVIDINLPISGSLDDPKFSVGGLIIRVIVNLITKAVTAPFALLGALFGGGEELSTLPFAPGSATPGPDARQRIATLGKALADRPALKLELRGHADPIVDREALRRADVENALRRQKLKSLAAEGAAPPSVDDVVIGADERVRWLTAAYRAAPLPDRPRNVLGMLKDLPPAEMEAMLYAAAIADDDTLRGLAEDRAQAVKAAIAATGVADERLFLVAPRIGNGAGDPGAPPAAPATRVDLALR